MGRILFGGQLILKGILVHRLGNVGVARALGWQLLLLALPWGDHELLEVARQPS